MAQRFYYLSIKFEDRLPKSTVKFAKEICDAYTKMAKKMELSLNSEELLDEILK
ncbi:hypothetical protein SAMN05443428_10999 [Caloramator quimbayensis]|uniref:Uncharacterized protein n=2 Tax=Caloramator quimbayensis TaxID=1147123 RepID=A0A1T4XIL3_9CLOT|nr:hypothetical protein SAMN05443428_10999 [Caloramator quimbayensis]